MVQYPLMANEDSKSSSVTSMKGFHTGRALALKMAA